MNRNLYILFFMLATPIIPLLNGVNYPFIYFSVLLMASCSVPWDYIPKRSYPLFQAREALRTLRDELRTTKRLLPTTPSPT